MAKHKGKLKQKLHDEAAKAKYLVLAPFVPAMLIILKARGVKLDSHKIPDVAHAFVANIINKTKFEKESFEKENLVEEAIDAAVSIVKKIMQYFKDKKAAKDAGEPLPPDEEAAVTKAEETIANIPDTATTGEPKNKPQSSGGDISEGHGKIGIFGILMWVLFIYVGYKVLIE